MARAADISGSRDSDARTSSSPERVAQPTAADVTTPTSGLLSLQRRAGNRAVALMLQREPDGNVVVQRDHHSPLSAAAIARARAEYRRRATLTRAVLRRVQSQLRVPPTGQADDATIHAVAAWQARNPPHPVTGVAAGPVLAALFPSGLATAGSQRAFLRGAGGLETAWPRLDAATRRDRLIELVNARLAAISVPGVRPEPGRGDSLTVGTFRASTWTMAVHPAYLSAGTLSSELVATVYHEARHAEQHFLVARYLIGNGQPPDAVASRLGIQPAIATAAARRPVRTGTADAVVAEDLLAGLDPALIRAVVARRQQAERVADEAVDAEEAAGDARTPAHTRATERAYRQRDAADAAYRLQNHEFDAFAVERALRRRHGEPTQ